MTFGAGSRPGAVQRALELGQLGRVRRERRAPAPQQDAAQQRQEGDHGGADRELPAAALVGGRDVGARVAGGERAVAGLAQAPAEVGRQRRPAVGAHAVVVELRGGRRGGGRRVEGDPAVGREVGLDPRVGVGVADHVVLALAVVGARAEARGHARRDAAHAQHERHDAGELLAVAGLGVEEEGRQRIAALGRVLVVCRPRLHAVLDGLHELVGRVGGALDLLGQRVELGVRRARHDLLAVALDAEAAGPHDERPARRYHRRRSAAGRCGPATARSPDPRSPASRWPAGPAARGSPA